jgi:hypothetical protein
VRVAVELIHRLTRSGALTPFEEDALLDGVVAGNPSLLSLARFYGGEPEAFVRHARRNLRALQSPVLIVDSTSQVQVGFEACACVCVCVCIRVSVCVDTSPLVVAASVREVYVCTGAVLARSIKFVGAEFDLSLDMCRGVVANRFRASHTSGGLHHCGQWPRRPNCRVDIVRPWSHCCRGGKGGLFGREQCEGVCLSARPAVAVTVARVCVFGIAVESLSLHDVQASSGINGVDPLKAQAGVDSVERFELDILNGDGESDRKDGDTSHVHTLASLSGDALQFIRDR